ncbi:hypothetical protein ACFOLF_31875 [Paenibacillus sepulcri]
MSGVYLDHLIMKRESKSFTDSLHAVLTATNLFTGPKYMLSGYTGMAFKFSVHEQLLPMSVSAYGQWVTEHKPAIDNLGIWTAIDGGRTRHATFSHYRQEAVKWVRESLNRGLGVIYWIPEFGVIHGYDDEDGIFYVQDGRTDEDRIVLYDNFGLNFTPFWYCQSFGEKVEIPQEDMILESFRLAVYDWETPYKTLPGREIASGKLAYTFLTEALATGGYDERGAVYILDSYLYSRKEIRDYLHDILGIWHEADVAFSLYDRLVGETAAIENCIVEKRSVDLIAALKTAEMLEQQAMELFQTLSARYPDLKRTTIPRWGAHSPR